MNPDVFTLTNIIVAITCLISFALMNNSAAKSKLLFHPVTIQKHGQWYRFLSSGFIHADVLHLGVNMFVLWSFGSAIEKYYYPAVFGDAAATNFLILYFGGIIVASIPSFLRHKSDPSYAALGASGGVSAVVFAVIVFDPWQNLYLYGIIAIPQILAGVAYVAYSWYKDKAASDNIGHMAHLTGAAWGFAFTCAMNFDLFTRFITKTLAGPSWL
ncbi:rhomboid family intramembrane serine protease [Leucothrix arctica]|uniref:Rhomboid family intramembrane serine protease n=1 Tax=Leucothrix arctica TaxID=1481894 RepID=A0A317CCR8_9GAMM|nr:rhomboid family intramembrane serine protease [Leucothrix arctica]PWQ96177.1 rhomboid family intramembrane serine protease [Leucothrix arctica]